MGERERERQRARDREEDGEVYNRFEANNNLQELVGRLRAELVVWKVVVYEPRRPSEFHQEKWLSVTRSLLVSSLPLPPLAHEFLRQKSETH